MMTGSAVVGRWLDPLEGWTQDSFILGQMDPLGPSVLA